METEHLDKYGLGRLVRAPARGVWAREATDFSPWLADNLDVLSAALGLALTLRAREHQVGRYWLDLLLEDARGRTVIVENQFNLTDHDHLGKLLTYAAGTEADLVVWIAEAFTEEHIAALEWLNSSTVPGVGFFAVQLEVLEIAAQRAPHFQVLVRPNEWVQTARRETAKSVEWSWETYAAEMQLPADRLEIGQRLVEALEAAIQERELPWQARFRKGYVAFQRPGGYNVAIVDLYWAKPARLAVKLPGDAATLGLVDPYPGLVTHWIEKDWEYGWTVPSVDKIPDVGAAIDLAIPFQPAAGPMKFLSATGQAESKG